MSYRLADRESPAPAVGVLPGARPLCYPGLFMICHYR